ncbi:MAG: hypothetical protein AAB581_03470 [Patescibacteria group bacterium]
MTTQIIFKVDKKLKEEALAKAHREGIPFSTVLKLATKAFVGGSLDVELTGKNKQLNAAVKKELAHILKEVRRGENLSPAFRTAREAMRHLKTV